VGFEVSTLTAPENDVPFDWLIVTSYGGEAAPNALLSTPPASQKVSEPPVEDGSEENAPTEDLPSDIPTEEPTISEEPPIEDLGSTPPAMPGEDSSETPPETELAPEEPEEPPPVVENGGDSPQGG
jgi:hypothetical protein